MSFLIMILCLICLCGIIYFLMGKIYGAEIKETKRMDTFRVKGTARGSIGRLETRGMFEERRNKVNRLESKF